MIYVVSDMINITQSEFVVVTTKCFPASVNRGNAMATVHKNAMMLKGSL